MPDAELTRLAARADLCRLLAACFYEPGPEFVEEKMFESLAGAAALVDSGMATVANRIGEDFGGQPLEALRVDYTRLFLHPTLPQALPYESAWIGSDDPTGRQGAMDAVVGFYRDHGFEVDDGFRDLPDHVAAELEFLYTVLFREAGARNAGDGRGREHAGAIRRAFVDRHLGRWMPPLARAMRVGAETPFYRSLAELAETFVAFERSQE